ncbi:universal stress protein [Nitrosopumilus sp.]|uniref:universal stress protein n=1 Tax=Nitrosopumilus sp. TaxID=2024843 RepID=UPI0034A08446
MALSFQHILVPYDGTKTGDKAFDGAIQLAKKFTSKITILSCIERESTFVWFETKSDKNNMKKRSKIMKEKIVKLETLAEKSEIDCKSKITNCSLASKCIVSFAKSHNVDLIVMSKLSKISPGKIYHDSTVNYVYSHVNCPMFNV